MLAVAAGLGAAWRAGLFASDSRAASVAVLPFENLSGDPDQAYFAGGLASEVRGELARNPQLQVVGQASSNAARGMKGDATEIARKLGVAFLVDGNVRREGGMVRVGAELIDGTTGINRWTETFERPIAGVFAVQSEIARAVARAISPRLDTRQYSASDPEAGGTSNVAAYDYYLQSVERYSVQGEEAVRAALTLIDQAIAADHRYGRARAFRTAILGTLALTSASGDERMGLLRESIAEARRAVAMSPKCAEAFATLGNALFSVELDVRKARAPFERARQLGAGDPVVLFLFALFSARTGRIREARSAIGIAETLDPLNPGIFLVKSTVEFQARDCPAASAAARRALALDPQAVYAYGTLGACQLQHGDYAAARASNGKMPVPELKLAGLAMVAHREGKLAEAQAHFSEMVKQRGDDSAYRQAQVLAQWGQRDRAIEALALAFRIRDSNLMQLGSDPMLDPLRDMPAYQAMKQRMGFD